VNFLDRLAAARVLAILRGASPAVVVEAATIIRHGGIELLEVSLTTPGALDAIAALAVPDGFLGAGTVLGAAQARDAVAAGARFLVTPGVVGEVIDAGRDLGVPVVAGALTPTEALRAWQRGATAIKVFPVASAGGPGYIAALRAPLPEIPLVAVGGVMVEQVPAYLAAGAVAVGIGGALLGTGDPDDVSARVAHLSRTLATVAP